MTPALSNRRRQLSCDARSCRRHPLGLITLLLTLCAWMAPATRGQDPLYFDRKPAPQTIPKPPPRSIRGHPAPILLGAPASSVADSVARFDRRAALAVYAVAVDPAPQDRTGLDLGVVLLGMYAYADYFKNDPLPSPDFRAAANQLIKAQRPGNIGSVDNGDYDMVLNLYVALLYQYHDVIMDAGVKEYIINTLMTVRGPLGDHESECENCSKVATIPETENHLFMIETARYLTNQVLYQRTHNPIYDNRRNGRGNDPQPTAVWLLDQLRSRLMHDFDEYNARDYQDQIMMALENLASYAYDADVRLAAEMVLDYLSAKVAVSSNNLRRATPFRRRNETLHWGPPIPGFGHWLFLRSPLLLAKSDYGNLPNQTFEPDPQGTWFAQLAGNTTLLGSAAPGSPGPASFGFGMVVAGTHDYRVPSAILDLFVEPSHRHFYQRFRHTHTLRDKGDVETVSELYAGSPSYLITAGGHPTKHCYLGHVGPVYSGVTSDLGGAMPTTFMPTGFGAPTADDLSLENMIQFGCYTDLATNNDNVPYHMGVAPDFACGAIVYIPPKLLNDPTTRKAGPWIFIDRGHRGENRPGYYLAIYKPNRWGFLEAYDTWDHNNGLTFDLFVQGVTRKYGNTRFELLAMNNYTTQSGRTIQFIVSPATDIVSVNGRKPQSAFLSGDVLNSDGSGKITITNPAVGQRVILDMTDMYHPSKTWESGKVTSANYDPRHALHEDVWVDFQSPAPGSDGDFYRPFKALAAAQRKVAPGGTIRIVPGATRETITLNKPMTLVSFPGGAAVSAR